MGVRIVDYDPLWPQRFEREADRLYTVLGGVAQRVEHVGSTAVPGLAAKDTVDIQVSVADLEDEDSYRAALEELGYVYVPDDEPQHRFFKLQDDEGHRLFHLHVCETASEWARSHIEFRDQLRADRAIARDYERVKKRLADRYEDRDQYAEAKSSFIADVLRVAQQKHRRSS